MQNRVVITGLGIVSSIGIGRKEFWKNSLAGKSGGRKLEHPWLEEIEFYTKIGAPVMNFIPAKYSILDKEINILDLVSQFALAATYLALADAGFSTKLIDAKKGFHHIDGVNPERLATFVGSGQGGLRTIETSYKQYVKAGRKGQKRYSLPMLIPNAPAAQVAMKYQAKAECKSISTACASGAMAIGDAYKLVKEGGADVALAGGAEAVLSDIDGYGLMGFDLLRTMSTRNDDPEHASRPFDKDRDGFVLSEGAGIVVLEELEFALARNAPIYAEVAGYESNCDAYSIMMLEPDASQIIRLMKDVIHKNGFSVDEIDYINAHGTSTIPNDKIETFAIKQVFGKRAYDLVVTSTKSMTGHAIGASGAIEAASTALSIKNNKIPPTINLETPDPDCDLNYLQDGPKDTKIHAAISNSYGFGGHNASLLIKKYK
jgi:3-oxoacyl-[acyl-carrier-protein] synthase II